MAHESDEKEPKNRFRDGEGKWVKMGRVNPNHQECLGTCGVDGVDFSNKSYRMIYQKCNHVYGANGSDVHERHCQECGSNMPGIPFSQ